MTKKTNKVRGWSKEKPSFHQKTIMMRNCGKKCFLGPKKTFPICKKNTCKRSRKGIYAAYVRAREYQSRTGSKKYSRIANKAKKLLHIHY